MQFGVLHRKTWNDRFAGFFHSLIFWGFLTLLAATTVVMLDHDFHWPIMRGRFYLYFQSLAVDVLGLFFVIGTLLALARRWVGKPGHLVQSNESYLLLLMLAFIGVTGFLIEGWRIAATSDPWGAWSPVGYVVARASERLSTDFLCAAHRVTWWCHLGVTFGLIAWSPYTKMAHALFAPINIFAGSWEPIGASLSTVDFTTEESFGVHRLSQWTWKDLLDLDACTECGRCTAACPAYATGKPLSPRDMILDLRGMLHANQVQENVVGATAFLTPEALWACTTCAACVEVCPVSIEQMPKIVDMRRHLVMDQAELPETMQTAIESMETRGHPFRGTPSSRMDWTEGLDIPEWRDGEAYDVLFWVGCAGGLVQRNQESIRATAQLLRQAGVRFAILGKSEKCTGDLARRIGHEFLFETLAKENIDRLVALGVREVVTSCPHCFNSLTHEYPRLGGAFHVMHHTEYLHQLVQQGRLKPTRQVKETVTFHDPCYLGRHNGVFDAPRELVQIAIGQKPQEMPRHRENSFCCGGGGGRSFVDEPVEQRVSHQRVEEAVRTGCTTVAVGCPFCMTMLEDANKSVRPGQPMKIKDVSEILWEAIRPESAGPLH
jgi:Fe-S oxidoreductase